MTEEFCINATKTFVKKTLANAEGGHDWFHIERVYKNSLLIAKTEKANIFVVSLAALLHDIADAKFYNGDETIGPKMTFTFLNTLSIENNIIDHVVKIIENISFKNTLDPSSNFTSIELQIVQDADRLDAIGAIGIARTFNYGGFKNRPLYNPNIPPNLTMTKEEYKNTNGPTINHFYEKLLLLKNKMNTKTGVQLAEKRHEYMIAFLNQFYKECDGEL